MLPFHHPITISLLMYILLYLFHTSWVDSYDYQSHKFNSTRIQHNVSGSRPSRTIHQKIFQGEWNIILFLSIVAADEEHEPDKKCHKFRGCSGIYTNLSVCVSHPLAVYGYATGLLVWKSPVVGYAGCTKLWLCRLLHLSLIWAGSLLSCFPSSAPSNNLDSFQNVYL
jgi:hypothetical protein